jgi:hypothetical protein
MMVYVSDEKDEKKETKDRLITSIPGESPSSSSSLSTPRDTISVLATADPLAVLPPTCHTLTVTPSMKHILRKLIPSKGRGRYMRATLGYIGALTTSSSGVLNAAVNCSTVATTAEFASFSGIFDEFFIRSFTVKYEPNNQFLSPANIDPVVFQSWSSTLLVGAPLYHGAASYTSASAMVNNIDYKVLHSGRPWTTVWRNDENPNSGVLTATSTTSTTPTQGWCLTSGTASGFYTGLYQYRTSLPLPFVASMTLGQTVITFDVLFRARA